MLACAASLQSPSAWAQTAPKTPETSNISESTPTHELVVPKEEAAQPAAPENQPPSLANTPENNDQGSLSGAFLSSYVAHNQGNVNEALRYLRQAYRKDPSNESIGNQVLILEITTGNMETAVGMAQTLREKKKHELIVDLLLSIEATKKNELAKASGIISGVKSSSFDHIWLPLLVEWMTPAQGAKPVTVTDILAENNSVPSFVHYHLGLINDIRGHTDAAMQHYQAATADLSRAPFRALMAYVNAKARLNDQETIQQLLLDLKQLRPDIEELLRKEMPYINRLGAEFSNEEGKQNAPPIAPFIGTAQHGVAEVLLTMASMLYTLDISQDIPLYLQMGIYLRPDFPTAQLMLGNYFESLQLWDEALAQYKNIRTSSPLYLKAAIRRVHVSEMMENTTQADALMQELTREFPQTLDVWVAAGDLHRGRSQFKKAIEYYSQAIKRLDGNYSKPNWVLFFARGACYERLGMIREAEQDLRQARNLSSDQPEVLNYIGYMWLEQDKKVFEAVNLINKAYKLSPHEPHIIDSMGYAFLKTGRLEEAIAMLEHAAEMLPNDPTINEHLGDGYWYANRLIEARYQWARAKDFSEDESIIDRLQHKVLNGLSTYSFHTAPLTGEKPKAVAPADEPAETNVPQADDAPNEATEETTEETTKENAVESPAKKQEAKPATTAPKSTIPAAEPRRELDVKITIPGQPENSEAPDAPADNAAPAAP